MLNVSPQLSARSSISDWSAEGQVRFAWPEKFRQEGHSILETLFQADAQEVNREWERRMQVKEEEVAKLQDAVRDLQAKLLRSRQECVPLSSFFNAFLLRVCACVPVRVFPCVSCVFI